MRMPLICVYGSVFKSVKRHTGVTSHTLHNLCHPCFFFLSFFLLWFFLCVFMLALFTTVMSDVVVELKKKKEIDEKGKKKKRFEDDTHTHAYVVPLFK